MMSKEPIRLTREEAQAVYKAATYRYDEPPKDGESWAIGFAFDAAERGAEHDPKDVQVGDVVELNVMGRRGKRLTGTVLSLHGEKLWALTTSEGYASFPIDMVSRIVTRATPQVRDTVTHVSTPDRTGVVDCGKPDEDGELEVYWPDVDSFESHKIEHLRIVHRPEGN